MKHPIMSGLAVTAVLLAAGLVANAQLEKLAHEAFEDAAWCAKCGRACLHGAFETNFGYLCHECGADEPEELWVEE